MNPNRARAALPAGMVLATMAAVALVYGRLPDRIPTHWSLTGQADAYGSKWPNAFAMPAVAAGVVVLFFVLPYLDPKRANYDRFVGAYGTLRDLAVGFICLLGLVPAAQALGWIASPTGAVVFLTGLMLAGLGNYMGKVRQNWYVGIRTPWTLSSEEVWNKTNRLGGKVWLVGGLATALGAFLPAHMRSILCGTTIGIMVAAPIIYSYVVFQQRAR